MMKILLAILLTMTPLLAAASFFSKASDELDIQEAAFRYQFPPPPSDGTLDGSPYFLQIIGPGWGKIDPKEALMKRFKGNNPRVKKISESDLSNYDRGVDKKTGRGGTAYQVWRISWISRSEASVIVWKFSIPTTGEPWVLYLQKIKGKWAVIRKEKAVVTCG